MDLVELGGGDAAHVNLDVAFVGLVATAVDGGVALLQSSHQLDCGHANLLVVKSDISAGYVAPRTVPYHFCADARKLVEALDEGGHLGDHGCTALFLFSR